MKTVIHNTSLCFSRKSQYFRAQISSPDARGSTDIVHYLRPYCHIHFCKKGEGNAA
jgi:hypothetical protein